MSIRFYITSTLLDTGCDVEICISKARLSTLPLAHRVPQSEMGKKKSQKGSNLKAGSGKRPERKYNADTDEDPRDHEFHLEDRAGQSSGDGGDSGVEDDDDMAVEMARELQALAGERPMRAVKQQKVAHAPRAAATSVNAASSSTPRALISSYFTTRTPVAAPAATVDTTPTTAPTLAAPTAASVPSPVTACSVTPEAPAMTPCCCICLEVIVIIIIIIITSPTGTCVFQCIPFSPKSQVVFY